MREVRPGIWHWKSPHPDWDEEQWWPELVSSYAIELGDDLVLFDPLSVPAEPRERATAVVLTAPYHERDARSLGLPVHTPPADTWQDWGEKFGIDPEKVRGDPVPGFGEGLDIPLGARKHVTRTDVVQRLRPLLDLPVELVLPAHGE